MQKRSIHIAIAVFAIVLFGTALMPSTAKAQPSCDAAMPRLRAIHAEQLALITTAMKTRDCSSFPKLKALASQFRALALGAGCRYSGMNFAQWAAEQKYCRTNVAQKPQAPKEAPAKEAEQKHAAKEAEQKRAKPGPTPQTECEGSSERNPCTFNSSPPQGTPKGKTTPKGTGIPKTTVVNGKPTACFGYNAAKALVPVDCSTPGAQTLVPAEKSAPNPVPIAAPPAPEVPGIVQQPSEPASPQLATVRVRPDPKNACPVHDRNGNPCIEGTSDSEKSHDWTIYKVDVTNSCECTCSVSGVDSEGVGRTTFVKPHSKDKITCIQTPNDGGCTGFKNELTFTCYR